MSMTLCFSSMMQTGSKQRCNDTTPISDTNSTEIGIESNAFLEREDGGHPLFQTVSVT